MTAARSDFFAPNRNSEILRKGRKAIRPLRAVNIAPRTDGQSIHDILGAGLADTHRFLEALNEFTEDVRSAVNDCETANEWGTPRPAEIDKTFLEAEVRLGELAALAQAAARELGA